jgi:small subunit ribosomal protein S20
MANIRSAKKRIRRTSRQVVVNRNRVGGVRTSIKKVEQAILDGDASAAKSAFQDAQPLIMRGAQKGIMHRNKASRTLSRLSARVKAIQA